MSDAEPSIVPPPDDEQTPPRRVDKRSRLRIRAADHFYAMLTVWRFGRWRTSMRRGRDRLHAGLGTAGRRVRRATAALTPARPTRTAALPVVPPVAPPTAVAPPPAPPPSVPVPPHVDEPAGMAATWTSTLFRLADVAGGNDGGPASGPRGWLTDVASRVLCRSLDEACLGADRVTASGSGLVFHAIGTLGPGGAERQLSWTVAGLQTTTRWRPEVIVAGLDAPGAAFFLPTVAQAHVPVHTHGEIAQSYQASSSLFAKLAGRLPRTLHSVPALAQYFAQRRPHAVHCWLDETNVTVGVAAVLARVPVVVLGLRSLPPNQFAFCTWFMRPLYRWLQQRDNVTLICNSEAGGRAYEAWIGLPPHTIAVLANGYPFGPLPNAADSSRSSVSAAPVVGGVMRLSEEKQPTLWLHIAGQLAVVRPDVRFVLVGDGPLRSECEQLVRDLGIAGVVEMLGVREDVPDLLAHMDLLLLTSRAEGLPNVLIEAQSEGVPVVTTPAGGAAETLVQGVTGWILDPPTPQEGARLLASLLGDQATLDRARVEGPLHARRRYGLDRMLEQTDALYGGMDSIAYE